MDAPGNTASVAQLVGTVGRLISKIFDAAKAARQNKRECEHLTVRLRIIGEVLPRLPQHAEVKRSLTELGKTLGEAHELVIACQTWSTARQLIGARRHVDCLKEVNTRIDSHIGLFNLLVTTASPVRFTWAELGAATNYFAYELSPSSPEALYKGRLHDGPEVAVKVLNKNGRLEPDVEGAFVAEVEILFALRHQHIVRLVGWCSEEDDHILVYQHEHMSNGTLSDHLLRLLGGSSPVRETWRARVEVLLGSSRAIEHLHRCTVIHRNVTSFNIMLDGIWKPRLSGFDEAILQAATGEGDQVVAEVVGTPGYLDPEYRRTGRVSPASDVYSFGMVILEALTGEDPANLQVDSTLLAIRNSKLRDVLDCHPATLRRLEGLELVAHAAECCLCPHANDRPDMSKVVASLERALVVIGHDESRITVTAGPPPSSSFGSLQTQPYEDGESSQPSEGISTLLFSRGNIDQVTQLKALMGILNDANAEPIMLSYPFLSFITGNFSQEIGRGGFGIVYQGDLGARKVAVKKLSISERFSDTLFVEEIKCLVKAKHNNVVRFLGYCADTRGELILFNGKHVMSELPLRLLCFEYVPNGNLGEYLKDKSHKDEWKICYQMIRGICHGLNYLHGQRINHLDLKPDNILLDACMEPKIADFGLSRCFDEGISRVYTKNVRGTMGCMAPETITNGEITFKSDIYGLGIIIIKLLTRCNYNDFENWRTSLDMNHPQVKSWAEIAQTCVHMDQHKRPTIHEIMQKLDEIESM